MHWPVMACEIRNEASSPSAAARCGAVRTKSALTTPVRFNVVLVAPALVIPIQISDGRRCERNKSETTAEPCAQKPILKKHLYYLSTTSLSNCENSCRVSEELASLRVEVG